MFPAQDAGLLTINDPPLLVFRYILHTRFSGEACTWCYLSAGLSLSLLLAVAGGMGTDRLRQEGAMPGSAALVAALATLYLGFGNVGSSNAEVTEVAYYVGGIW